MAEVPGAKVFLVERNAKKAAFLREALRVTSSPGEVILADIGDSVDRFSNHIDCITARAVAPLHELIGFAEPFLKQGSRGLFMKGQDVEAELTEAAKYWKLNPLLHPSLTGGKGWIVDIDHVDRHNPVRPSPHGVPNERN
jgi:16S rRNA (guanine527-N7)-methyltransferase